MSMHTRAQQLQYSCIWIVWLFWTFWILTHEYKKETFCGRNLTMAVQSFALKGKKGLTHIDKTWQRILSDFSGLSF